MALTLPYPNMDFVPLDILTASELDQMVANIEYIASGSVFPIGTNNIADNAVTNAKIASNAVTSDKIDFTTYSNTEKACGTWTDGKTIYKKTIYYNNTSSANTYFDIPTGITNGQTFCGYEAVVKSSTSFYSLPFGEPMSWLVALRSVTADLTSVRISGNLAATLVAEYYITLYYTKSA